MLEPTPQGRPTASRLTGREVSFDPNELIVSKTDLRGRITYANDVFCRVSGYTEAEILGAPHSLVRHPAMPRCVFKYLWDELEANREVFAYVLNRCKNGDEYWVFAHVTPSRSGGGRVSSYHSSRRVPSDAAVASIRPVYDLLLSHERTAPSKQAAAQMGLDKLISILTSKGISYGEFVFSL